MKTGRLAFVALAAGVLAGVAEGRGFGRGGAPLAAPAPPRPAGAAAVSDPAEPQPGAEVTSGGSGLSVASSARSTTLKFNTSGAWQGSAGLTFKKGAPPMRFTLTLAQMQQYDLGSLTLTSGKLSLQLGRVSSTPTTRYFDASGREQSGPERAAYTVTARRYAGEVDVEVKRAPGAALGKQLSVSWACDVGHAFTFGLGQKGG
jgi:hypothetical protein